MRRILVDQARRKRSKRAGGNLQQISLSLIDIQGSVPEVDLLSLNEALDHLAAQDPRACEVVKLRFFAGLTVRQVSEALDVSVATIENDWVYAKSWLNMQLAAGPSESQA